MTQSYRLHHLFQKYLRNQCSAEETEELMGLLNDMEDDELDAPMKALWERARENQLTQEIDWDRMLTEVMNSEESLVTIQQTRRRNFRRLWINVAAAAAILVFISVGVNYFIYQHNNSLLAYAEKDIPVKQTDSILLDDGSKIVLDAGSSLRYPKHFNGKTREVFLEGQAIFDVAHDPNKPFIVHSGQLKTIVLGTKFVVTAYPGAERMSVTVLSGKVSVQETVSKKITTLLPNQQAVFNVKNNSFNASHIASVESETVWQQGRMGFDDASLPEVAAEIYRHYGIHVKLANSNLVNCHISIVLGNDSIDNVLRTITSLTNSNFKYQDGDIVLYGEGCK